MQTLIDTKRIDQVMDAMERLNKPATAVAIAQEAGLSETATRLAISYLTETDLVHVLNPKSHPGLWRINPTPRST